MEFKLRFSPDSINEIASRYSYPNEKTVTEVISPAVQKKGYFTRDDFLAVAFWKSPRNEHRHLLNEGDFIMAVTKVSLSTPDERLRIEVLTLLDGVNWPTASVFLHFGHSDAYPILDFRALWSLGVSVPKNAYNFYDFDLWRKYTQFSRALAKECSVSMRVLDRALWQYSKENQKDISDGDGESNGRVVN